MFCQKCGKELNESVVLCPYCNTPVNATPQATTPQSATNEAKLSAKKPKKKKKRIIIIVAALLFLFFLGTVFSDTESSENESNDTASTVESVDESTSVEEQTEVATTADEVTEESAVATTEATTVLPEETEVATTQKAVTVDPFVEEFYDTLQDVGEYTLSDASREILQKKSYLFPCSDENFEEMKSLSEYIRYEYLTKSVTKYAQTIICIDNAFVIDIQEVDEINNGITYIHVCDENGNDYVGYVNGTLPEVFEGDEVTIYGLPLDIVYFDNLGGGTTMAVFLAVCACTLTP